MKNDWKSELLIMCDVFDTREGAYLNEKDVLFFIEKLLTQQKEEDAQIAEGQKKTQNEIALYVLRDESGTLLGKNWYNQACDDIAKAIRAK